MLVKQCVLLAPPWLHLGSNWKRLDVFENFGAFLDSWVFFNVSGSNFTKDFFHGTICCTMVYTKIKEGRPPVSSRACASLQIRDRILICMPCKALVCGWRTFPNILPFFFCTCISYICHDLLRDLFTWWKAIWQCFFCQLFRSLGNLAPGKNPCRQRASGRTFGRTSGRTSGRRACRQRRRKKNHLIEAAPFGRLDQM